MSSRLKNVVIFLKINKIKMKSLGNIAHFQAKHTESLMNPYLHAKRTGHTKGLFADDLIERF